MPNQIEVPYEVNALMKFETRWCLTHERVLNLIPRVSYLSGKMRDTENEVGRGGGGGVAPIQNREGCLYSLLARHNSVVSEKISIPTQGRSFGNSKGEGKSQ